MGAALKSQVKSPQGTTMKSKHFILIAQINISYETFVLNAWTEIIYSLISKRIFSTNIKDFCFL